MSVRTRFRSLHKTGFILPNPWDVGSARLLASLGFEALATTSAGHANSLGRIDGRVTRDEALDHARTLVEATPLPVSADLEQGFGDDPEDVAETVRRARDVGLAGCSIEDYGGEANPRVYDIDIARERIAAAVEAAGAGEDALVVTARAENQIRGNPDLKDTIARLQAYQEAGAPVLYAPGLANLDDIRSVVAAVDRPVNALILPGGPSVSELYEAGVKRVSTGSVLSMVAQAACVEAGRELLDEGSHGFWSRALAEASTIQAAFAPYDSENR